MSNDLAIAIFSEVLAIDQRLRSKLNQALPKGLELSHFSALNHLVVTKGEATPAGLATALNVSRGAMTNTLSRLENSGYIHIHRDWEDARKKFVSVSTAGKLVRDIALNSVAPIFKDTTENTAPDHLKEILSSLRNLRQKLG